MLHFALFTYYFRITRWYRYFKYNLKSNL